MSAMSRARAKVRKLLKPGQRCTHPAGHKNGHDYNIHYSANWRYFYGTARIRCEYVELEPTINGVIQAQAADDIVHTIKYIRQGAQATLDREDVAIMDAAKLLLAGKKFRFVITSRGNLPYDARVEEETADDPAAWTMTNGIGNSSPEFVRLSEVVTQLILDNAHALLSGRVQDIGRHIMAHLAHNHDLAPWRKR